MKCPCKDCEKKGCGAYHSQCEDYLEWKSYNDAIKKKALKDKQFDQSVKEIRLKGRCKQQWER